jgi:hypothetical protein
MALRRFSSCQTGSNTMRLGLGRGLRQETCARDCAECQRGGAADQKVAATEARLVRNAAIAKRKPVA